MTQHVEKSVEEIMIEMNFWRKQTEEINSRVTLNILLWSEYLDNLQWREEMKIQKLQ